MADVVIRLAAANIESTVSRHAELLTRAALDPRLRARELVFTRASHAFHDLGSARVKHQAAGQNHASGFFRTIRQGKAVAHAFAIEIDVGGGV